MSIRVKQFTGSVVGAWHYAVSFICGILLYWIKRTNDRSGMKARISYEYKPRKDDIFISTFPKSGTTWMQMILYQLTTSGDMSINHINDVSPFFELTDGATVERLSSPRLLKTHLSYDKIPKTNAKYIYVTRDIKDVIVSCYHHYCSIDGYVGTFDEFFDLYTRRKVYFKEWGKHVSGWLENRDGLDILYLNYEDLVADTEQGVRKIIAFLGLDIPETEMPRILERTTFSFMKAHENKFDIVSHVLQLRRMEQGNFIRKGKVAGGGGYLKPAQMQYLENEYTTHLGQSGLKYSFE